MRRLVFSLVLGTLAAGLAACGRAPAPTPDVVVVHRTTLPADPLDRAWADAPQHVAPLLLQDIVEPRLMTPSTAAVRVKAMTDGTRVAFLLEWDDAEADDRAESARFPDACAVQLPAAAPAPDLPAPQMGEPGRGVEITFWRASWQAVVDGRGDTIKDLHPNASVDHYPFEAAPLAADARAQAETALRYAPARALGNAMAGPRERPVETLVAEGPGTLAPAPAAAQNADGRGRRTPTGWAVVISRPLPAHLRPGARGDAAFAVWQGSRQETGAKKMRTGWVPLLMETAR